MKKQWIVKILALVIVVLFIGVSFQPIIAENTISVEKKSANNNVDFKSVKEYLFQTIIEIANNPDVKGLLEKNNHKILTYNYDYKGTISNIIIKKPKLLFNIFTKPSFTYSYLDKSYKKGVEFVNILDEKKVLRVIDSIKISNQEFLENLTSIITNNEKISDRILTLKDMNTKIDPCLPLQNLPIICAIIGILLILVDTVFVISFELFYYFLSVNNSFFSIIFGNLRNFSEISIVVIYFIGLLLECWYFYPPHIKEVKK